MPTLSDLFDKSQIDALRDQLPKGKPIEEADPVGNVIRHFFELWDACRKAPSKVLPRGVQEATKSLTAALGRYEKMKGQLKKDAG